jgi:bla regulator protein blaR1
MNADLSFLVPLANHLWQSTVCVGIIWLLTIALKKNHAAVRYWLWFAASLKFLIPFSAFVALGSRLSWRNAAPAIQSQWSFVVDNAVQPFSSPATPVPTLSPHTSFSLLPILMAVWLCGVGVGVVIWLRWWTRMRRVRRNATPLVLELPIPVLSSATQIEPGVLGIFRPVLLLPEGIESRLTPAQLDAILAHEMVHVRRRDNLTAAIHIVVETAFWFFPVVWWLRAQLIEERENACDEAVLGMGGEAESYAEGIIEVCKSYTESPAAYVSGISGSNLKKRIIRIVNHRSGENLTSAKKVGLALATVAVLIAPLVIGLVNAPLLHAQSPDAKPDAADSAQTRSAAVHPLPSFEVASIKPDHSGTDAMYIRTEPDRFIATNVTAKFLIEFAFNMQPFQISGDPAWTNSELFDIDAKEDESLATELQKLPRAESLTEIRFLVQSLLLDRFKMEAIHQTEQHTVYTLVVLKSGPTFSATASLPDAAPSVSPPVSGRAKGIWITGPGQALVEDSPISSFVGLLSRQPEINSTVTDATNLAGHYDFKLQWTPVVSPPLTAAQGPSNTPLVDPSGTSIFDALEEQLGLKLESKKGTIDTIMIDHIEQPSGN